MKTKSVYENSDKASAMLTAMANPKRLMILCILIEGEVPVGSLATKIGLSQSALSQHLSKLRALNLVKTRRDAQTIYYSSNCPDVIKVLNALETIYNKQNMNAAAV